MTRTPVNKTQATDASVDAFIAGVEDAGRREDAMVLLGMMQKITGKPAVMWGPSIIGFDNVHYKYDSGREGDMGAVGFSPRKSNLVVYLVDGCLRHQELINKLGQFKTGKTCLYLKRLADVDLDVLAQLITTSYKYVIARKDSMHRAE